MRVWKCGRHELPLGRKTYVMGIINLSPDSFAGDGTDWKSGLNHALEMVEQGADLLDIGGESSRPGALPVPAEEELNRILPLVDELVRRVEIPLSVDTSKAVVAKACMDSGISIVNDISGGTFDPDMLAAIGAAGAGCILMHMRGTPRTMGWSQSVRPPTEGHTVENATDVIWEIKQFWAARVRAAEAAGVGPDRVAVDPGFGFGKSVEENLEIIRSGHELADFGYPLVSATSRKSTVGKVLGDAPVSERIWGTAATVALSVANGCDVVRVHDVREMVQVVRLSDAVMRPALGDNL